MKKFYLFGLFLFLALCACSEGKVGPTVALITVEAEPAHIQPPRRLTLNPEDPARLLLPLNEGLSQSMLQCGPNAHIDITFEGFNAEGEAIINGEPYKHRDRLILKPQNCGGKRFDSGWVNILDGSVYYQVEGDKELPSEAGTPTADALSLSTPVAEQSYLRVFYAGHEIIMTAIKESLANVRAQSERQGFTIQEGEGKCYAPGDEYPIRFQIKDAKVGEDMYVQGMAGGDISALSADEEVYGVFIRYSNTERWGFLPLFYHGPTSSVQKCVTIIPLTLSGPTSTIPSDPPKE